ncbi:MAG: hypothetical protein ACHQHN_07685 [Sphingobacteriales bacterium]
MNTKLIMTASAILLAAVGISLSFFPNEIAKYIGLDASKTSQLVMQALGALYFGFAILNWMAKGSIIGGIYNKPLVVANLSHFMIGGLALIKGLMSIYNPSYQLVILTAIYTIFGILFGILFVRHPANDTNA